MQYLVRTGTGQTESLLCHTQAPAIGRPYAEDADVPPDSHSSAADAVRPALAPRSATADVILQSHGLPANTTSSAEPKPTVPAPSQPNNSSHMRTAPVEAQTAGHATAPNAADAHAPSQPQSSPHLDAGPAEAPEPVHDAAKAPVPGPKAGPAEEPHQAQKAVQSPAHEEKGLALTLPLTTSHTPAGSHINLKPVLLPTYQRAKEQKVLEGIPTLEAALHTCQNRGVSQRQYRITPFLVLGQLSRMHMMVAARAATVAAQDCLRMMQWSRHA